MEGYELLESEEALGEVFDLGVLDVGGLERLASRVRERREGGSVPCFCLFCSWWPGEVPARFLGEVVDEVIFFPFEPSELRARVEALLGLRRLSSYRALVQRGPPWGW